MGFFELAESPFVNCRIGSLEKVEMFFGQYACC